MDEHRPAPSPQASFFVAEPLARGIRKWRPSMPIPGVIAVSSIVVASILFGAHAWAGHPGEPTGLEPAVSRLGELNGVALACRQTALAARLRELVIEFAPKERTIGEWFERATSESFLEVGRSATACPDGRALAQEIEHARDDLLTALGVTP